MILPDSLKSILDDYGITIVKVTTEDGYIYMYLAEEVQPLIFICPTRNNTYTCIVVIGDSAGIADGETQKIALKEGLRKWKERKQTIANGTLSLIDPHGQRT